MSAKGTAAIVWMGANTLAVMTVGEPSQELARAFRGRTVHLYAADSPAGIVGMRWEWS